MGINAIRLIMSRNEVCLPSEDINYIASFRNYKNKSVSAAARSFINTVRDVNPDMLDKEY